MSIMTITMTNKHNGIHAQNFYNHTLLDFARLYLLGFTHNTVLPEGADIIENNRKIHIDHKTMLFLAKSVKIE